MACISVSTQINGYKRSSLVLKLTEMFLSVYLLIYTLSISCDKHGFRNVKTNKTQFWGQWFLYQLHKTQAQFIWQQGHINFVSVLVLRKMDGKVWVCFVLFSIAGAMKNDRGKWVQLSKFFIVAKVKCCKVRALYSIRTTIVPIRRTLWSWWCLKTLSKNVKLI